MNLQVVNILAIVIGPVIAVLITLWHQSRKEKRYIKLNLYLTLMKKRKSYPVTIEYVDALNTIDVVFHKHREVLRLWHEFYDVLLEKDFDLQKADHKLLDLLFEMSKVLGFKNIKQTDIDKFYTPIAHNNQILLNSQIQNELLRVLQKSDSFATDKKDKK